MLTVVEALVDELVLNQRNPRLMREERERPFLRAMVEERALLEARPVIALREGKRVIAGNQRVRGARKLGWSTIPTVFVDVDEVREAVWMFLDNRGFGEDDEDLVAEILGELKERGADLDLAGFERVETDRLLRRLAHRDRDADELPVLPEEEPESQLGCLYELGRHRLFCGDATDPDHVAALLDGAEPALIVTDPPYGVELDNGWRDRVGLNGSRPEARGGGRRRTRVKEHVTTSVASDQRVDWSEAYELVPSARVGYVWHASRHACEVQGGLERAGFQIRQQVIWDKGLFVLSRQSYHWRHEPCLYAVRPGAPVPWFGSRDQSTIWEAASPKMVAAKRGAVGDGKVDHPTQKPVVLFSRPVENHLRAGEALYDPFGGSGTSLIAAELTGRVAFVMELDPRCCDLIRARYEEFTRER
jgi:DNA modification methylase